MCSARLRRRVIAALCIVGVLVAAVWGVAGCATIPEEIGSTASSAELFRQAQDAYNATQYELALRYYELIVVRFGTERTTRVTAEYEIAYIHFRTGEEELARAGFEQLLAEYRFNSIGFPRWVYVLSERIYDKIVVDKSGEEVSETPPSQPPR